MAKRFRTAGGALSRSKLVHYVRRAGNEAFQPLVSSHPSKRVARTVSAWSR